MINAKARKAQDKAIAKAGFTIVDVDTGRKAHLKYTVTRNGITITGITSWSDFADGIAREAKKCWNIAKSNGWTTINAGTKAGA
jgi:hypothetical protein